jgi:hypothetical protein
LLDLDLVDLFRNPGPAPPSCPCLSSPLVVEKQTPVLLLLLLADAILSAIASSLQRENITSPHIQDQRTCSLEHRKISLTLLCCCN